MNDISNRPVRRFALLTASMLALGVSTVAQAAQTKTVGIGQDFTTIQAALDYAAAQPADDWTINVDAGTYAENVVFNAGSNYTSLKIVGVGGQPIIGPATGNAVTFNRGGASDTQRLGLDNIKLTATGAIASGGSVVFGDAAYGHLTLNNIVVSNSSASQGIQFANATSAHTVDDVIISNSNISNNTGAGIRTGSTASVTHLTLDTDIFDANGASHVLLNGGSSNAAIGDYDNLIIEHSTFGNTVATSKAAFSAALWLKGGGNDSMNDWLITDNTFTNTATTADTPSGFPGQGNNAGILLHGRAGDSYSGLQITDNIFDNEAGSSGALWYGLKIDSDNGSPQFTDVLNLTGNTFENLRIGALSFEAGGTMLNPYGTIDIHTAPDNTFTGISTVNSAGLLVPEPSTFALLGVGALVSLGRKRRLTSNPKMA